MLGLSGFERSGAPGLRKIWSGGAIFHEFGQVGEIRRLGSTRFWRVWQLGCDFSSVWASRGDSQVRRHAVLEGLAAGVRAASASRARAARSEPPPPHTPRTRSLGLAGRSWSVWVWVGSHNNCRGWQGARSRFMTPRKVVRHTITYSGTLRFLRSEVIILGALLARSGSSGRFV